MQDFIQMNTLKGERDWVMTDSEPTLSKLQAD